MAKGKILKKPFVGYVGYKIWHKKEGRYYVCLVPRVGYELKRTTITLAKYRLSRKLGRRLSHHEQVDHKDEDRTNDRTSNLQILTNKQNCRKQVLLSGKTERVVRLKCPNCGSSFRRRQHLVKYKIEHGHKPCCSRKCGGQWSHRC